jgi:hypothetical protein
VSEWPRLGISAISVTTGSLATCAGAEVSDQLKYFAQRLPATFQINGGWAGR